MIGDMPASRIGDLHVCPMTTGPVPHVGGPFVSGIADGAGGQHAAVARDRSTDVRGASGYCDEGLPDGAGGHGRSGRRGGSDGRRGGHGRAGADGSASYFVFEYNGGVAWATEQSTAAPPGGRLPPVTLQQKGWPDLPASHTPNFQTAQPVDLPPGTKLYRVIDDNCNPSGSYWALGLPADEDTWRAESAVKPGWNSDGKVAVFTVPPEGMKAWMGPASSQGSLPGGGTQLWVPPERRTQTGFTPRRGRRREAANGEDARDTSGAGGAVQQSVCGFLWMK